MQTPCHVVPPQMARPQLPQLTSPYPIRSGSRPKKLLNQLAEKDQNLSKSLQIPPQIRHEKGPDTKEERTLNLVAGDMRVAG